MFLQCSHRQEQRRCVTQQPKAQQRQLVERGDAVPIAACGERSVESEVTHYVDDTSGVAQHGKDYQRLRRDQMSRRVGFRVLSALQLLCCRTFAIMACSTFESARLNPAACPGDATSGLNVWPRCFHDEYGVCLYVNVVYPQARARPPCRSFTCVHMSSCPISTFFRI